METYSRRRDGRIQHVFSVERGLPSHSTITCAKGHYEFHNVQQDRDCCELGCRVALSCIDLVGARTVLVRSACQQLVGVDFTGGSHCSVSRNVALKFCNYGVSKPLRPGNGRASAEFLQQGGKLIRGICSVVTALVLTCVCIRAATESLPTAGTRRMAERLENIAKKSNPMALPFLSRERAEMIDQALRQIADPKSTVDLRRQFAIELLNAGRSADAVKEFRPYEQFLASNAPDLLAANKRLLRTFQAMCYLRLAEQQNCLSNHTTDSCLLPIRGSGVHKFPENARAAAQLLGGVLQEFPQDLSARWLLNIAQMTLGEYPEKVSAQWLIPPATFASAYDIKRFNDVSGGAGLDVNGLSGGSIMEDFDGDGFLDVMVSSLGFREQLRYFRSNGNGTFTDRTIEAGLIGEVGGLNILQTDYNNDGAPDVLVLRGGWMRSEGRFPNSLLRNRGDGTFDDVTEAAGLLSFYPTQTATWFDFNSDGWLDLFIGNESVGPDQHPCELFRNNGDGTFTECAADAGVAKIGYVKGVASGDFNKDGRPDLYLSLLMGPNVLYRNDGLRQVTKEPKAVWKFTDVTEQAGVTAPANSFPCWFFDYNNDGWPDLFVSGYFIQDVGDVAADYLGLPSRGERAKLYHNNRDGTFSDVTRSARLDKVLLTMGCNFGDLDNDGWLDFYLGTGNPDLSSLMPNRMFRNAEGKFFQDVTTSGGFGHLQKGHGISFGDIDNDGDQDIYEKMGGAFSGDIYRSVLFENPGHGNHWLTLKLTGVKSNRAAIGAQIKVTVATDNGDRDIFKTVSTGASFGASPLRQEIGLGSAKLIRAIEIFWPATGVTQRLKAVAMDRFYHIREGDAEAVPWPLKKFQLPAQPKSHHHHAGQAAATGDRSQPE